MAKKGKKISELPKVSNIDLQDVFPLVQDSTKDTKSVKFEDIKKEIFDNLGSATSMQEDIDSRIKKTSITDSLDIKDNTLVGSALAINKLEEKKVDKEDGKSLVNNNEIEKLLTVEEGANKIIVNTTLESASETEVASASTVKTLNENKVDKKDNFELISKDNITKLENIEIGANKTTISDSFTENSKTIAASTYLTNDLENRKANQTQVNDIAASVDVLAVTKAEKSVVDALMNGYKKQNAVDTYNDTSSGQTSLLSKYPNPEVGWDILVRKENTRYNWNGEMWVDMDTGVYDETIINNLEAKVQTSLFGKSTTFGLTDSVSINIVCNSIRDIYISDKSINTKSLAVCTFGKNTTNNNFYLDIADMTGKGDESLVTAAERTIRCDILEVNTPHLGVHRFDLKRYDTTIVIGWVEIDFSLYFSDPIYLASSDPKTFLQSKINFNEKFNNKLDISEVKKVSSIPKSEKEVPSHQSVHNELFKEAKSIEVYDGFVDDKSIEGYISTSTDTYATAIQGYKHIVIDVNAGDTITVSGRTNLIAGGSVDHIQFLEYYNFVDGTTAPIVESVRGDGSFIVPKDAGVAFIWVKSPTDDDTETVKVQVSSKSGVLPRIERLEELNINAKCYVKNNINNIQVYTQSKSDASKYIMFQITHEIDNSEIVYKNLWRITKGGVYRFSNGQFTSLNINLLADGENEFTMKFKNKADYTGGVHGDERIDTVDSFVLFNIDGVPLSDEDLSKVFFSPCSSFGYTQYSTLHETTNDGTTSIDGHPIVARHLKRTIFTNEGYVNYNMIKLEAQSYLDQYHSGLYCTHKDTANTALLSDSKRVELIGSNLEFSSELSNSLISLWNVENHIAVDITSCIINGLDDLLFKPKVWDRATDSKYYRRLENMNMTVEVGRIIESEMTIIYKY